MALTPLLIRLAPRLGMVDLPDRRKVHAVPIPRVGGIGIVAGALTSLLLWLPMEPWLLSYLFGAVVLLVFGAADDSMEIGHYPKFVGQFIAAVAVVYWGGLWVSHFPFLAEPLAPAWGKPFTVFALVGVMNAINHSDGLDGLAGGESLLSMGAVAFLAYLAGGTHVVVLAAAVIGSVFGFLRFNTHPARVFMGDSGSQFIGYSLGVMVVFLTQQVNTELSMALPLLLIGLPIIDILAVFGQRIHGRMNWFRATRNHIHHRLLDLGFSHYHVVVLIYLWQAVMVACGILMAYESDLAVALVYGVWCGSAFALIVVAERFGWRAVESAPSATGSGATPKPRLAPVTPALRALPLALIELAVPVYLLVGVLLAPTVPADFAPAAACVLALAALSLALKDGDAKQLAVRSAMYLGGACVVFLTRGNAALSGVAASIEGGFFVLLGLAVALALRLEGAHGFRTTPLDFLMVFAVVVAALSEPGLVDGQFGTSVIVRLVILFYAAELAISRSGKWERPAPQWSLVAASLLLLGKTPFLF
jgi:UDP-GlcNAc:undecaprenyl-phosphate GlcNAc-1-phosphate transferase